MIEITKEAVLKKLIEADPKPLNRPDFGVTDELEENFIKLMVIMERDGLINANFNRPQKFMPPIAVAQIALTREGAAQARALLHKQE